MPHAVDLDGRGVDVQPGQLLRDELRLGSRESSLGLPFERLEVGHRAAGGPTLVHEGPQLIERV